MCKPIFDHSDGTFILRNSDSMGIDSNGDLHMRIGDTMSLDLNTGELHITSSWEDSEP